MSGAKFEGIFISFSQKPCEMGVGEFGPLPAFSGKPTEKASLIYLAVPPFGHR
jgi:O-succinylbenzoate synthase